MRDATIGVKINIYIVDRLLRIITLILQQKTEFKKVLHIKLEFLR